MQGGKEQAFDPERVEILKELSQKPDAYERLARAIAPYIYENEDVKKGSWFFSFFLKRLELFFDHVSKFWLELKN